MPWGIKKTKHHHTHKQREEGTGAQKEETTQGGGKLGHIPHDPAVAVVSWLCTEQE